MAFDMAPDKVFVEQLLSAIRASVAIIAEEEIKAAQERVVLRVREQVGIMAINVAKFAEISMLRDRLVIEVRLDDSRKATP